MAGTPDNPRPKGPRGAPPSPGGGEELHLRTAIDQSPLGTVIFDPEGRCLLANPAWYALWGSDADGSLEGSDVFENPQVRAMGLVPFLRRAADEGEVVTPLLRHGPARGGPGGGTRWFRAFVYPVRGRDGGLLETGLVVEDYTERKALEDRLAHQALHDPLTGLPNRALLMDRLEHALSRLRQRAQRGGARNAGVALLFMDLDDFKHVNDSLGHHAGDRLLVGVAERLSDRLRPGDTLARFGGDEFAVLLDGTGGPGEALGLARRLLGDLRAPFVVDGREVLATASIGVTLAEPGEERGEDLLRRADTAMYRAKEGKDRCELFRPGMDGSDPRRLRLEADLRRAMEAGEFRVHYQPKVRLETGEVVGFEALVRWEHPGLGLLAPDEFVPLAEETGLIVPLGRWVLAEACRQGRLFREIRDRTPGGASLRMSVNISARQFRHPQLVEEVAAVLSDTPFEPRDLALEITEGAMMADEATARTVLRRLRELGVKVTMDDFGSGYSALSFLKEFPVDALKIDRPMIKGVDRDRAGSAIVAAVTGLGHALGLAVVAEGVETAGELGSLRSLGCDFGQGHYWRGPCPAEEATELLTAG